MDRDAAERVLRRAVHLDGDVARYDERVAVQALLDAADELGIDRSEVQRAIVEEGTMWLGATTWRGERLLRISVSNWMTSSISVWSKRDTSLTPRRWVRGAA